MVCYGERAWFVSSIRGSPAICNQGGTRIAYTNACPPNMVKNKVSGTHGGETTNKFIPDFFTTTFVSSIWVGVFTVRQTI